MEQRLLGLKEGLRKLYGRNIDVHRKLENRLFLKNVLLDPHVVHWDRKSNLSSTKRLNLPQADVLANKGHIALWGDAGTGKSSLCQWMAWEWSQSRLKDADWEMYADLSGATKSSICQWMAWEWSQGRLKDVEWLIYIDLSGAIESLLKESGAEGADIEWSLFDLLNAYWRQTKVINVDENEAEHLVEAMGEKWMLVFDGLDEARTKSDTRVLKLLDKVRDAKWNDVAKAKVVILFGRAPERDKDLIAGHWTVLEIVGLGEEQRRKYVASVFAHRTGLACAVAKELETEPLNDLACVPLQLQMICLARRYGSVEEFKGVADVYIKTLDLCLRREVYLKEREVATAEDEKTVARLLKTLEDLAGGKDGVTVEEKDAQLLSRSGIVYRLDELSEEEKNKARREGIEVFVDEAPTWKWYHASFKDLYRARRAVGLVEALGKDANDWDRAVCFREVLWEANVLCCRMAMWTAKEVTDMDLFRGCFWGWLNCKSVNFCNDEILFCKELEGWKEAASSLCHINSFGTLYNGIRLAVWNSCLLFERTGCWNDAMKLYEEFQELQKRLLGPEHPRYLMTLSYMACVYKSKGLNDEALKLYEECRLLQLKVLGPEHPDYLMTLNDIACVVRSKGQFDEALKLYEECRLLQLKVLGPEHPDYLMTLNDIACVYQSRKQFDEALKLYEECREVQKKLLGPEHPDYLMTLRNIGGVLKSKGWFDEALKIYEECRVLQLRLFGPEDPNYLTTLSNMADVLKSNRQYDEALTLYEECRVLQLRVLGPEHPNSLTTLSNIAGVYVSKGQYDEALKTYEECRMLQLKVLGPEHPEYLKTLNKMANVCCNQRNVIGALPLMRESVATGRKIKFHLVEHWASELEALERQLNLTKQFGGKKIGPNDLCPCKSGKKYKKCCKNGM